MAKPNLGRPKGKGILTKTDILKASLLILDESGSKNLTMRRLAQRLRVTPMALYHHVADRSTLLRELSDMVYGEVSREHETSTGGARERLERLLVSYHQKVIEHPNLSISIFETPEAFSEEAKRITRYLMNLLEEAKIPKAEREIWLDILVDFTHGSSIATAMRRAEEKKSAAFVRKQSARYAKELNMLLRCVFQK